MKLESKDCIFLIISAVILLPLLFFPIATDNAVFIQAGKIIAQGGLPYVDFIDIKPHLIYYFYSLIYLVFGSSEFAIHLFDFLFQMLTVWLLYATVAKATGDKNLSGISSIVYALSYTIQGHNQTMQIESYIPLLTILIIRLLLTGEQKKFRLILIGLIAGCITAFKFTMFFVVFTLPIYDYFLGNRKLKESSVRFAWSLAGFLFAVFLALLPFLSGQIRSGFSDVMIYLGNYAQIPALNSDYFRDTLKMLGRYFGDKYSLLFSISLITGILSLGVMKSEKSKASGFAAALLTFFILLSLSVVAERKFFEYHFSRIYAVLSVYTAAGLIILYDKIKSTGRQNKKNYILALLIAVFLLVMSPLSRWTSLTIPSYYFFADKYKYENYYNRPYEGSAIINIEQKETAGYIIRNSKPNDRALVVSVASSVVNYRLGSIAQNKFMLSCFFISNEKISNWRKAAIAELMKSRWLVLQENDPSIIANHHALSSRQYIMKDDEFGPILLEKFHPIKDIGNFYIYERNANY